MTIAPSPVVTINIIQAPLVDDGGRVTPSWIKWFQNISAAVNSGLTRDGTALKIGIGTPAPGTYVDGGTGAWTELPASGGSGSFADSEAAAGSGTAWTLANPPAGVPQLFVELAGFGLVGLLKDSVAAYGYSITGTAITTVSSYSAGQLRAWYRY